jgi:hypothetical protein
MAWGRLVEPGEELILLLPGCAYLTLEAITDMISSLRSPVLAAS